MLHHIDTHCHLSSEHFMSDVDLVIGRCLASGVSMLATAGDVASSRYSIDLARRHDGILASTGVHPNSCAGLDEAQWRELVSLAQSPEVAAIGETGLDYYWKDTPRDVQKKWFIRHIELALATDKVLSIHARNSVSDTLDILRPYLRDGLKGIWHCFVAGKREIDSALEFAAEHNLYLALGGLVTFEDQKPLRKCVPFIPDELLLLETDAPYLSPRPKTRDRNEPDGVIRVAEVLAELRGTTPEEIANITTQNARALLGFPPLPHVAPGFTS